jgi:pyruvate dehydrogenase (quinone)
LLPLLNKKTDLTFLEDCVERYREARKNLDSRATGETGKLIHPEYLTKVISNQAQPDAIFTADVGTPTVWAARYLDMKKGRRLLGSFNHGSMACAMPQSIGAQIAFPDRQVISLSGDGGFGMMMGEILTIFQYNLPVKLVIYNNGLLGFVAMEMKVVGIPPFGTELKNPNFAKMAEAIGIMGIRVENSEEVPAAIEKALAHDGPVVIDVLTNPTELTMPPQINITEAKGFSIYMLRQTLLGDGKEVFDTLTTNFLE